MIQDEKAINFVNELCTRLPYGVKYTVDLQSPDYYQGKLDALNDTLSLLNILEMKVDTCYEKILKFSIEKYNEMMKG